MVSKRHAIEELFPAPAGSQDDPASPRLPPEMVGRPDARELRAFILAYLSISNPAERRRILEAVEDAAS